MEFSTSQTPNMEVTKKIKQVKMEKKRIKMIS